MVRRLTFMLCLGAVLLGQISCERARDPSAGFIKPENELERALVRSALGEAPPGQKTFDVLVRSRVYVRVPREVLTNDGKIIDPTKFTYATVMVKGSEAMALYTSEKRLTERFGSVSYVYLPGDAALEFARGKAVVVNEGLAPSVFASGKEVEMMLRRWKAKRPYS